MTWLSRFERLAWTAGVLLLAVWAAARIHSSVLAKRDLRRFEALHLTSRPTAAPGGAMDPPTLPGEVPVDYSLWSPERIKAYEETLRQQSAAPLAVLRIPKIGLEVPVLAGTDGFTLNRAVGVIEGTARPGEAGNVGIAGHRDGFFRGLKDVAAGDLIELATPGNTFTYRIADIRIVHPENVEVLAPTTVPTLTLVTCHPFYFTGSAPERYIVRAVRQGPGAPNP